MDAGWKIPRWFLVMAFSLAGIASLAWAGWVTDTCLSMQGVPEQIHDMAQDIKYLIRHGLNK